jgi:hypothetical protein
VGEGSEREVEPPPVAAFSETTPVAVGTAVWALLFVIGLFLRPVLADSGREWWIWSAGAGVVLGLGGYAFLRRRRARLIARSQADPGAANT